MPVLVSEQWRLTGYSIQPFPELTFISRDKPEQYDKMA